MGDTAVVMYRSVGLEGSTRWLITMTTSHGKEFVGAVVMVAAVKVVPVDGREWGREVLDETKAVLSTPVVSVSTKGWQQMPTTNSHAKTEKHSQTCAPISFVP